MAVSRCLVFIFLLTACNAAGEWDYDESGSYGPSNWAGNFAEFCALTGAQSPIDIVHDDADTSTSLEAITFKDYTKVPLKMKMTNNGHTVVLTVMDSTFDAGISDGSLGGDYKFEQLHFHWGTHICNGGSEHTFDGKSFPMEMHLVHYNRKHASLSAAVASNQPGDLAVLGVMYNVVYKSSESISYKHLAKLVSEVLDYQAEEVANKWYWSGSGIKTFSLKSLLPDNVYNFYRYDGSLTTPTCNEIVIWTVFKDPVEIDFQTMRPFTEVKDKHGNALTAEYGNFRPVQSLASRTVYYRN